MIQTSLCTGCAANLRCGDDAWNLEVRTRRAMSALRCAPPDHPGPRGCGEAPPLGVTNLSGGEKRRVALARLGADVRENSQLHAIFPLLRSEKYGV